METALPPQPPPDAPAPNRGRSWPRLTWGSIIGLAAFGLLVAAIFPIFLKQRPAADRTTANNHLKQMGLALFEFDSEYGRYPDAATIPAVRAKTGTTLALGSGSSNELFRQLLATGLKSETIFWAKTSASSRKRPNDILGADALAKGECSYAYVAGLRRSDGDPDTPMAMAPMIPGTLKFDPEPYGRFAVVLFLDCSVRQVPIDSSGNALIERKNLFDPAQPYWKGKAPDIKWPE